MISMLIARETLETDEILLKVLETEAEVETTTTTTMSGETIEIIENTETIEVQEETIEDMEAETVKITEEDLDPILMILTGRAALTTVVKIDLVKTAVTETGEDHTMATKASLTILKRTTTIETTKEKDQNLIDEILSYIVLFVINKLKGLKII